MLDASVRTEIIETLLSKLRDLYVFPEIALQMEAAVRQHMHDGAYDDCTEGAAFAQRLTEHLRAVCHDLHLEVFYNGREASTREEERYEQIKLGEVQHFGFYKVERLAGNIGYLDIRALYAPDLAGEVAVAAMNFVADTYALIIDLRLNHGGSPEMIALLCSYLLPTRPVHLNTIYWRVPERADQFWTLPYVPGKRYLEKPVYVLTSSETFSGAEELAYNLKNLKRATLIGETTRGGAHPGRIHRLNAHFSVYIPNGRSINPITGTNWEGSGVSPDIAVPRMAALATAHRLACQHTLAISRTLPLKACEALHKEVQDVWPDVIQ
jgi:C-terminal processing protease CtpA/Prc